MKKETVLLALGVGLLPATWAVVSAHLGIEVGAIALIVASYYSFAGGKPENGLPIMLGLWLGDAIAAFAVWAMSVLPFAPGLNTWLTLAVLGFAVVMAITPLQRWFALPAVLGGWAVALLMLAPMGVGAFGTMPLQIAVAEAAGIWYVGWLIDKLVELLSGRMDKRGE